MVKLGKKARKFAQKHLQSVLKRRRKFKAIQKKRSSSRNKSGIVDDQVGDIAEPFSRRISEFENIKYTSLEAIFSEGDSDVAQDKSDSDGFLSEGSSCPSIPDSDTEMVVEDKSKNCALSMQNSEIHLQLEKKKKKFDMMKEKDSKFLKFLETNKKELESYENEEMDSDQDREDDHSIQSMDVDGSSLNTVKILTTFRVQSWIQLVSEQHNVPALAKLLNGYLAACNYGNKLKGSERFRKILNSEAFCNILMFTLNEADNLFRALLQIPSTDIRKDVIMELKKGSKWKTTKPLIKSYLRSTILLLNQVTNSEILVFSLTRLRRSIIFFTFFPSLLHRLIKVSVHLWATSQETLSLCSFYILRDVCSTLRSDCFDICLTKTYRVFMESCNMVDSNNIKHIQFLRDSFLELCSIDVPKSVTKALVSIQQLAKIIQQGLQSQRKGTINSICSWQYVTCIDVWVLFISVNIKEYDLLPLLFTVIQIINGVAKIFCAPKYIPLRFKCVEWLNCLSISSGVFIPVASMVLDTLEYNYGKDGGNRDLVFIFSSNIKLPKNWLKYQNFQEVCVLSAIELLSAHFAQWCHHISFPDLATIPLICMRRFYEKTTIESLRRVVKRFIDQVEQNVGYVQKKRDEAVFSPKDQDSVESFLLFEKSDNNASFTQYYKSIMEKAASRNASRNERKRCAHLPC